MQKSTDTNDVDLTNPLAEVTMKSGTWVAVQADQGQYREDPGRIDLEGDVHLYHDQGYEMTTSAASMDLDQGIAWGTQPTEVHGPRADINAQGFKMLQEENEIIFTGPSRLVLKPEPEEASAESGRGTGKHGHAVRNRIRLLELLGFLAVVAPVTLAAPASADNTNAAMPPPLVNYFPAAPQAAPAKASVSSPSTPASTSNSTQAAAPQIPAETPEAAAAAPPVAAPPVAAPPVAAQKAEGSTNHVTVPAGALDITADGTLEWLRQQQVYVARGQRLGDA